MNTLTIWGAHIKARDEALSPQDYFTAVKRARQCDRFTEELRRRLPLLDLKAAEIARLTAEVAEQAVDAKAWRTLRRYERLLIAGFCSYADLNAAKAEAQQAAQEATV